MQEVLGRFTAVLPEKTQYSAYLIEKEDTPAININGEDIAFLLELPQISLPVGKVWNKNTVKEYPCIFQGSVGGCDLMIACACTENIFSAVSATDPKDTVFITDVYGRCFPYTIQKVIHSEEPQPPDPETADMILVMKKNTKNEYLVYYCKVES